MLSLGHLIVQDTLNSFSKIQNPLSPLDDYIYHTTYYSTPGKLEFEIAYKS